MSWLGSKHAPEQLSPELDPEPTPGEYAVPLPEPEPEEPDEPEPTPGEYGTPDDILEESQELRSGVVRVMVLTKVPPWTNVLMCPQSPLSILQSDETVRVR